jgi:hypothetical protein
MRTINQAFLLSLAKKIELTQLRGRGNDLGMALLFWLSSGYLHICIT